VRGRSDHPDQYAGVRGERCAGHGSIAIRDAQFEYAATKNASVYARGGNAPLEMTIVNSAATVDKLVSASSPVARSVKISGNPGVAGGRVLLVEGEPAAAAPVPAPASTPSIPPTSAGAPDNGSKGANIVLMGVNQDIRPGLTYPVTLTFQNAGAVTVAIPVGNPTTPRTESAPE